jgi:hypothetical protein
MPAGCGYLSCLILASTRRRRVIGDIPVSTSDNRRKAIRRTLEERAGGAPDAAAVAEAAISTWHQVADRLAPVIGVQGVNVLFSRSLHLTSATFQWLVNAGDRGSNNAQLATLEARLAGCKPEISAEASYALLVTFTELLTTLIGEPLTDRLLNPVWEPSRRRLNGRLNHE